MNVAGPIFVGGIIMSISLIMSVGICLLIKFWPILIEKVRKKRRLFTKAR
jgi:hypothetical protein